MADISKITTLDGTTYNLKDTEARNSIPDAATGLPEMNGAAAVGNSEKYAREDHIHPSDDNKLDNYISVVSGNIITFSDGIDRLPLKKLVAQINPVQSGSGDPSPNNIRSISGWTGVNGQRTGVNVWDEEWEVGGINWTTGGNSGETDRIRSKGFIPVKPNTQYNFTPEFIKYVWFFDYAKNVIPKVSGNNNFKQFSPTAHELTIPNNCYFIRFLMWTTYGTTYNHDISINYPSTDTSYHAYTGETLSVNWQSTAGTVYGGNLTVNEDGSGVLTVDKANIASYAGEALTGEWISDRDVYAQGTNPTVGAQVVYALATPLTYNLTEEQLTTLLGTNNIWVDTGNISITYYNQNFDTLIANNIKALNGHTVNSDVPANAVFTDTTYESKVAASDGTDVSLVTTGEKYIWNNKADTTTATTSNAGLMSSSDKSKLDNLNKFYLTDTTPASANSGDLWFIIEEEE